MLKLFTVESELDSAQRLGFQTSTYLPEVVERSDNDIIYRWGNSHLYLNRAGQPSEFKNVINQSSSISLNVKKHEALRRLAMQVDTPKMYEKKVPNGKLAVVRPIKHTCGVGFSVKKGPLDLSEGEYATEYVKTKTEYRVWFINNNYLCAKRVAKKGTKEDEYPCRSEYYYKFCKLPAKLGRLVRLAAKSIGLVSGAADVLRVKRKFYFCELNSSPSIDHRKIRLFFQAHIPKLVKEIFPQLPV